MTPDPAPYGADLPRPPESWRFRSDATAACALDCTTALDAANAEVLRLRAERDALREVVEAVREECRAAYHHADMHPAGSSAVAAANQARAIEDLLPAPTEGDG